MSPDERKQTIARQIRKLRRDRELSIAAVAEKLGMNAETYRLKETAGIGVTGAELAQIARMYDLRLRDAFPAWEPSEGELILAQELSEVA